MEPIYIPGTYECPLFWGLKKQLPNLSSNTWMCLVGDFFTDSTMVNHHFFTTIGGIFLELFPSIEHASPSISNHMWRLHDLEPTFAPKKFLVVRDAICKGYFTPIYNDRSAI